MVKFQTITFLKFDNFLEKKKKKKKKTSWLVNGHELRRIVKPWILDPHLYLYNYNYVLSLTFYFIYIYFLDRALT